MARRRNKISFPRVNGKTVIFTGGVNEGITNLELRPGDLFRCLNYEEVNGVYHGYSSVQGFERYDGQPSPSDVFVQLIEDSGNDGNTRLLLESEDAEDTGDKSQSSLSVIQSNTSFSESRSKFGDGSWLIPAGLAVDIEIEQDVYSLPFDGTEWTLDGWFQNTSNINGFTFFEKQDVIKATLAAGSMTVEFSTNGGASYNKSMVVPSVISSDRWTQFTIVYYKDEVYIGINGDLEITLDITGETIHNNTNSLVIGDGTNATANLYVDSFRFSDIARWRDVYVYEDNYAYSDGRYFLVNADDRDREAARTLINPVPGEGYIRDLHVYNGIVYAVRDDVGGVNAGLYKESNGSWIGIVPSNYNFDFTNSNIPDDTNVPLVGEAWTAAPSGATGVVFDYVVESGNAPNITGYASVVVQTGTLALGDVITITSTGDVMTVASAPAIVDMGGGFDVDFQTGRFAYFPPDAPNQDYMYFIANAPGFFASDGSTVVNMRGPDVTQHPRHIMIFDDRLWLGYDNGQLWYSAKGDPANFSTELGAGLIFIGDSITNLLIGPGGNLIIMMENTIKVLSKNSESSVTSEFPYTTKDFTDRQGAYARTGTSLLGDVFFCDDRGPTSMTQVDAAGDFDLNDMKRKAHITYQQSKGSLVGAYVFRTKSQYRIMFNDADGQTSRGIYVTFQDKKVKGVTLTEFPVEFTVFEEGSTTSGDPKVVAGCQDGYVYWLDRGTSFDGQEIDTSLTTAFHHYGTPRNWKRFHRLLFEISSLNKTQFYYHPDFNYSTPKMMSSREFSKRTLGQAGTWGIDEWGSFVWGGSVVSNPMIYFPGYGYNMSIGLRTVSKYNAPHIVHNMITDYSNGSRYM